MKRILSAALVVIGTVILLNSCQKAPFVTLNTPRSFSFTRDGGTQNITFTCNRDWSVSSSEPWIQVSPSSGTASDGEITVIITCSANMAYDPRSATVTVKVEELSEAISISQDTGIGLIVSPKTFELTNAEQTIELKVTQNVAYSVVIPDDAKSWVFVPTKSTTKGLVDDKIILVVDANTTYDDRETSVTIKQNDGSLADTVKIKQAYGEGLIPEKTTYDIGQEGGTIEVAVQANVKYEVTLEVDWIHHVETKALSASTIVLLVDNNSLYTKRNGTVSIKQINGELISSITINQAERVAITSIWINKKTTALIAGSSETLTVIVSPDNATDDKTVYWSSSDESVATVENGKINAISAGKTIITAKAGDVFSSCNVRVQIVPANAINLGTICNDEEGDAYYIFWANRNIGASKAEEYGGYYAWGVTEANSIYPYKWAKGDKVTKYCPPGFEDYWAGEGSPDGKTTLDPEDDVAHVVLGGDWRMPKGFEFEALINQCTWSRVTKDGIKGTEFKSKVNNNSIFLPAAGYTQDGINTLQEGIYGHYWSSGVGWSGVEWAGALGLYPNQVSTIQTIRSQGFTIRAVIE